MTSTLPTRWQEILRREAAEHVGAVLAQAREQPPAPRVPRWVVPSIAVIVASVSLVSLIGGTDAKAPGTVPFDRSTMISTRSAGLGASAEDLAPRLAASPPDAALVETVPIAEPTLAPTLPPPAKPRRKVAPAAHAMQPEAATSPTPTPVTPTPTPAPAVINIGTRLGAVLTEPIVTGAALAPATAKVLKDVYVGDRVVIPAGTLLVGEAFATQQDDRAQVVFSAMVKNGKTLMFEGWALQQGEMGIHGKVIRKGSKAKKGTGALLGAAASALTFGLAGVASGPEGAALSSLGNSAASEISTLGRDWRVSDKVLRVEANAEITVYLRRDVSFE